ncbi:hypothetical protein OH76DRAFT_825103 [Lentinus brumalis]|uniref:Uncharacterized protein n=1 Tax=Lentinus brumalis TaxID=2498619 RepID=A0A371D275_9APHY|nr:hypothetical protein OH76DRAFT_825103 [Polyporus brumalis]
MSIRGHNCMYHMWDYPKLVTMRAYMAPNTASSSLMRARHPRLLSCHHHVTAHRYVGRVSAAPLRPGHNGPCTEIQQDSHCTSNNYRL